MRIYLADIFCSWNTGSEENCYTRFQINPAVPSTTSITSATLHFKTSSYYEYSAQSATTLIVKGLTGTVASLSTASEIAGYSLTTASALSTAITASTTTMDIDITAIMQELVTASQLATTNGYTGLQFSSSSQDYRYRMTISDVYLAMTASGIQFDERGYYRYQIPRAIPSTASITSATFDYVVNSLTYTGSPSVRILGIEGSVSSFATAAEVSAYSFTSASVLGAVTTSQSVDVTSIVQENVTASQLVTENNYTGLKLQPNDINNVFLGTVGSNPLLSINGKIINQPSRAVVQTGGIVEHKNNNMWEKSVNILFLYNGVSKVIT